MKSLGLFLISSLLFFTNEAWAGWNSGGGLIHREAGNPWFLENTPIVNYCVVQNPQMFHADPVKVKEAIADALRFWQEAIYESQRVLRAPFPEHTRNRYLRVGTQKFYAHENCSEDVDLRFQMGTLNAEQRLSFGDDPREYIGATVLTSYDRVSLRGKGFIYLAADSGPLRPEGTAIHDRVWEACDGCVLRAVLLHEIGHLFGAPHEMNMNAHLMSSKLAEHIANQKSVENIYTFPQWRRAVQNLGARVTALKYKASGWQQEKCDGQLSKWSEGQFFGLSKLHKCFRISLEATTTPANQMMTLRAYARASYDGEWEFLGEATGPYNTRSTPMTEVWLPAEQNIFPTYQRSGGEYFIGLERLSLSFKGNFQRVGSAGTPQPFEVKMDPIHGFSMAAVVGGAMDSNLFDSFGENDILIFSRR